MLFASRSIVYAALALSIFASPLARASAPICRAILAPIEAPVRREIVLLEALPVSDAARDWQKTFSKIRNSNDFADLIAKLEKKDRKEKLADEDYQALQDTDLRELLSRFSPADEARVNVMADAAALRFEKGSFSSVDLWLYPLSFANKPSRAVRFAKSLRWYADNNRTLQGEYLGKKGFSVVSRTLVTALMQLPPNAKAAVEAELSSQIQNIDLKEEITTRQANGRFRAPVARKHRRNVEIVLGFLERSNLYQVEKALTQAPNTAAVVRAVDAYFAELDRVMAPVRGNYSFRRALEIAQLLQLRFKPYLTGGRYMDIYGSLGNGKAAIATSDVDVKLSHDLLTAITGLSEKQMSQQLGSPLFADMIERNKATLPAFGKNFWKTYLATEEEIARTAFHREVDVKSDTLTSFFPPIPLERDANDGRWYNPIILRVYAETIEIQIVDLLSIPQRTYIFAYRPN